MKCDGTRAETKFRLSAKRTSPFKSAGGRQFSRLLAAEVCASAVVMLDTPRSEVVWRVLATDCIRQFPLQFPSHATPRAITFQLQSTTQTKSKPPTLHINRPSKQGLFYTSLVTVPSCTVCLQRQVHRFTFIWQQPARNCKCTLVQALRLCTGRTAHRRSRGIALLLGKGKVHPCTGTEALYRPYGP